MITQYVLHNKNIVVCVGSVSPNEKPEFQNEDRSGESIYLFYSYDENYSNHHLADIYYDEGNFPVYSDTLYDLSFLLGKPFQGIIAEKTTYWIAVNPIPPGTKFNYEKIDGPLVKELPSSDKKRKIIVLRGTPIINEIQLEFLKVGNVSAGKTINLNLKDQDKILLLEDI